MSKTKRKNKAPNKKTVEKGYEDFIPGPGKQFVLVTPPGDRMVFEEHEEHLRELMNMITRPIPDFDNHISEKLKNEKGNELKLLEHLQNLFFEYKKTVILERDEDTFNYYLEKINRRKTLFSSEKQSEPQPTDQPKLTLREIGLLYQYKGGIITNETGPGIAKKYGHKEGSGLYQRFTFYSSTANRINISDKDSEKVCQNKVKRFEKIIPLLEGSKKQEAIDHLGTLQKKITARYN